MQLRQPLASFLQACAPAKPAADAPAREVSVHEWVVAHAQNMTRWALAILVSFCGCASSCVRAQVRSEHQMHMPQLYFQQLCVVSVLGCCTRPAWCMRPSRLT